MPVMQDARLQEKRRWPRLPISFPLFVRGEDGHGAQFKELATAINVSAGGILLALSPKRVLSSPVVVEMPVGRTAPDASLSTIREIYADVLRTEPRSRANVFALKFRRSLR